MTMLVLKQIEIKKEVFTVVTEHLIFLGQKTLSLLKEVKNRKELHLPLIVNFVLLIICIALWKEQASAPNEVATAKLALLKTKPALKSKPLHTVVSVAPQKKKPLTTVSKSSDSRKTFDTFKEVLAHRESGGNYRIVNTLGYLGKYQFGASTLHTLGIYNTKSFLGSPELQEIAFVYNVARNKWILRNEIRNFRGQRVNGVLITESGIIAAAHLSGPGNVKKYLRSRGGNNAKDAYGTSLQNYMESFGGYNISFIPAVQNPRL